MAVTYQSITTQSSTATTCVVTKPGSLAVGDLMVAVSATYRGAGGRNITLPTGFTSTHSQTSEFVRYNVGYKIAESADVSASNFTFTADGSLDLFVSHLIRLTTTTSFPTNPVIFNQKADDASTTANPTFSLSIPSVLSGAFLVASFFRQSATDLCSGYTSAPTNQTWTERYDSSTGDVSTAIATATNASLTTFISYELNTTTADDRNYLSFLVISDVVNATASNAFFQNDSEFFSTLTGSTQEPNNDFQEYEPVFFPATVRTTNPTQWVNEAKPSTSWTNETL